MMLDAFVVAATAKPLPGVFHHFQHLLDNYGYLSVGVVLFAENTGVPFPGETLLIAAALYAGAGGLNIWLVLLVAILASIAGSCFGYVVGARGGRPLADRYGKYVFLTPARLDRVEEFFAKHGWKVVVLGRFVDGVRQFMSIVIGISEMTFRRLLLFTTIGAVVWCAVWAGLGYLAGNHVETISKYFTYFAIGIAVITIALIARHILHGRRTSHA